MDAANIRGGRVGGMRGLVWYVLMTCLKRPRLSQIAVGRTMYTLEDSLSVSWDEGAC